MDLLDGTLSHQTLVGRVMRLPLRLIPRGTVMPTLTGPARGLKWIVGAGPHSCWLGINERVKRERLATLLYPGSVFFDVGAHVGSYTMLAARLVGDNGQVIAFEPVPENVDFLLQHITLNQLQNVRILDVAVHARQGTLQFQTAPDRLQGHSARAGHLMVDAVAIDSMVEAQQIPEPNCIKIDVEGDELDVLRGAARTIWRVRPVLLIAVHSERLRELTFRFLLERDYTISELGDRWELLALPRKPK
jgi:FkbM family methyltransferase